MNIAIIPARGGSQRIPHKNRRMFHGKPIIAYSIQTALASRCFTKVYVSTDDAKIGAVARAYGAKIHHRPPPLARNEVGTQEVTRAAIEWLLKCSLRGQEPPEFVCCIYPTAPLMTAESIRAGLEILHSGHAQYVYTVGTNPRQDAGQWYWGRTQAFLDRVSLEGDAAVGFELPAARVCDINTEDDWIRAEGMYQELQERRVEEEARQ